MLLSVRYTGRYVVDRQDLVGIAGGKRGMKVQILAYITYIGCLTSSVRYLFRLGFVVCNNLSTFAMCFNQLPFGRGGFCLHYGFVCSYPLQMAIESRVIKRKSG